MSNTKTITHNISSPGWRLLAAVLLIAGCWGFAKWFEQIGILEYAATVLVVAIFHLLLSLGKSRTGAEPEGRISRVTNPLKQEFPILEIWLSPGSPIIESVKGLAKGAAVVLAQKIFIWGSAVFLSPIFGLALAAVVGAVIIMPNLLHPLKKAAAPARPTSTDVLAAATEPERDAA